MKLLVIIALGMKYFIAWSAAGSYNEYDENVYDEEQQNPILKAKLGSLLLGKNLLLGKLLLGKKILLGGLPGFPYHRYPYGKFRHGYGLYGHSKLGRKFHVEQHDPILKEIFGAPLLGKAFSLGKQLLGKLLLGNSGLLGGLLGFPYGRYFFGIFRHGYGLYGRSKPGSKFDMEQQDPILKTKLGAHLLGKKLLLGGLLGFPYVRYSYGKLGYRYGPYGYGKLSGKFVLRPGIPGKGSYYDVEEQKK